MNKPVKLACFIHSANMSIHKTEILDRILYYLKERDILEKIDFLLINNIGTELDETYYKNIHKNIIVANYSTDNSQFECITIKQLITFSKIHTDYNILYLHTKGVSYSKDHPSYNNIVSWINYMLYCLVDNLQNCVDLLNYYDIIGCNFRNENEFHKKHYSGNFWWAKTAYLQKLKLTDFNTKYDAELCILSQTPNYFNIYTLERMYETYYSLETYKCDIQNGFKKQDNNIYYCKLGWQGVGLCNQLYSLISCIFKCIYLNSFEKIIILDDFLTDINTNIYTAVEDIFDLESMNLYLKKYNIVLLSKHNIKLNIKSILYGNGSTKLDVTHILSKRYFTTNNLYMSKDIDFNRIVTDPWHGIKKKFYITYTLNNCEYTIYNTISENNEININFKDFPNVEWHTQNNIRKERQENFLLINDLLVNIHFKEKYHTLSNNFINSLHIQPGQAINIIHLRNEEDAIPFWGNINHMHPDTYKTVLEDKYIYLIEKYIDKNSLNIILSMNTANKVIDFMQRQEYKYVFCDKNLVNGREVNAIIDLLNGTHCNNIYIGNVNLTTYHGSTFSYVLYKLLEDKPGIKKILIDPDNIYVAEVVL